MKILMHCTFLVLIIAPSTVAMDVERKHIMLPIEGVLFEVDGTKAVSAMGSSGVVSAAWTGGFRSSLKNLWQTASGHAPDHTTIATRLFDVLQEIEYQQAQQSEQRPRVYWRGLETPYILVHAWLQGHKTCEELQELVVPHIKRQAGRMECASLEKTAQIILDPTKNAHTLKPKPDSVELLKALRGEGHTLHVVDNWNGQAFDELQKQHPETFELINGHLHISGKKQKVKSATTCTLHDDFFETHQDIAPETAVFIETEEQHTRPLAGKSFNHVLCQDTDIKAVRATLQKIGLLGN